MKRRITILCGFFLLCLPCLTSGQTTDTARELNKLVRELKGLNNIGYHYVMEASFPNGENDRLKGAIYLNNDEKFYYNECNAFTMIYTEHFFYNADHRSKMVSIVNLDKDYDKRLKKIRENEIFQNVVAYTFLDSVLLKTAVIKKISHEGELLKISLIFPKSGLVQKLDLVFNEATHLPVIYDMTVAHKWLKTSNGVQVIETKIKCSDFANPTDQDIYRENNFFSYDHGKIELKKYKKYKLSQKM